MADIAGDLNTIQNKRYGVEIRDAIHHAIDSINTQINEQDEGVISQEVDENAQH